MDGRVAQRRRLGLPAALKGLVFINNPNAIVKQMTEMKSLGRECIHTLWDELARYPATQADEACRHLLRTVSDWIGATHAAWLGSVRVLDGADSETDPLFGWRVKSIQFEPPLPKIILAAARMLLARNGRDPGMTVVAMARHSGSFRVNRLHDGFIDFEAFRKTDHYAQHYRRFKVNDRLWIGCPVSPMAESFVVFDKRRPGQFFTDEQAELAATVMRGLTWLQLSLLLHHGIGLTTSPLTAMERRVLRLLLTDRTEKQIAEALNQSVDFR